jgi:rhamnulokinase
MTSAGPHVIAVDLGATSGRVIRVGFNGRELVLEETNRFANTPVYAGGTLYWDALRLWHEIQTGIEGARHGAVSIGVDCWGVDWALLDRNGKLLSNPVHYRDSRTDGMYEWVFERVPRRTIFERTGLQFMIINGLFSLSSLVRDNSPVLDAAATFLPLADLFNYWLTGNKIAEFTQTTTEQMYNPRKADWDLDTLSALDIPTHIFPQIVQPGTRIGEYSGIPVTLPGSHDTASAVVAVPTTTDDFVYISSGTWSLMGMEISEPVINDACYEANMTNEGGVFGTFRLLKNVMGMWLVEQSRETWRAQGHEYDYATLVAEAAAAEPFRSLVDPDDPLFLPPGDIPARLREFCQRSQQPEPETPGQVMRCIYESLALKYRVTLDKLISLTGRQAETVHIVGGGSRAELLCQMTADACNRPVVAGPVEATALGNAIVQMISLGVFSNVAEARALLARTAGTARYEPKNVAAWEAAYERFKALQTTN